MSYDDLRLALHGYIHRDDQATTDNEVTALELARQAVGRRFFPREALVPLSGVVPVDGVFPLPADFAMLESVIGAKGQELEYRSLRDFQAEQLAPPAGPKNVYTMTGAALLLSAGAHDQVSGSYFAKPAAITGTGSNWLSANYADVWLHAAIAEQWRYLQDFDAADLTDSYWQRLAGQAQADSRAAMQSGGAIRIKGR
jgi:hypothetical protein